MSSTGPDRDFAFGGGGFAKLYGEKLAESSLLDCAVATRWVFLFMLARSDAEGRFRCASVRGLARAAAITHAEAKRAVAELEAPDPDSTTKAAEGRRVLRIPGGWQITTHKLHRDFRTPRQVADAERQRRHRDRKRDVSRDVTATSAPDVRRQIPENGNGNGGPAKGPGASTARELHALSCKPEVADIADHWLKCFRRRQRQLGVLRAANAALAGGYSPDSMKLVIRVASIARQEPERFPERSSIRWSADHGKAGDPSYILRPSTLDRLIPEAEEWDRA